MKNRTELLKRYIQGADGFFSESGSYYEKKGDDNEGVIFCSYNSHRINYSDLEAAEFISDGTLVINRVEYNFVKMQPVLCPIELLNEDDLVYRLQEIANDCEGEPYMGYSGRCMYGEKCYGITCNDVGECVSAAKEKGVNLSYETDSMGRDIIVYWPELKCTKKEIYE